MPVKRRKNQAIITCLSILTVILLDQSLKALVSSKLTVGQSLPIIRGILHVTLVRNPGAAFGLFKNGTAVFITVSVLAVLVISGIILRSIRKGEILSRPLLNFGLILIVSGALGNLIDRLRLSYVIDFIDVRIWPVFNIADSSITIGTIFLLIAFTRST